MPKTAHALPERRLQDVLAAYPAERDRRSAFRDGRVRG
jgi:hypothetical protein